MIKIDIPTTTATQPSIGMPVVGSAFVAPVCAAAPLAGRRRDVAGAHVAAADAAVVVGAIWGTSAWRPPVC